MIPGYLHIPPDVVDFATLHFIHAPIVVLLVAGLIWAVSRQNSPAHKLAVPLFICAVAAEIMFLIVTAIPMLM